jgi:hypothetical protein
MGEGVNRGSLGFARDDKGERSAFTKSSFLRRTAGPATAFHGSAALPFVIPSVKFQDILYKM